MTRSFGLVGGEAILGANSFCDLFPGIRDILGGRSAAYEQELQKAKTIAIDEMSQQAREMGANAVVAVDLDYETMQVGQGGGMLMVGASGTAGWFRASDPRCASRDSRLQRTVHRVTAKGLEATRSTGLRGARTLSWSSMDVDGLLRFGISERRLVTFTLHGFHRRAEPHDYGIIGGAPKLFFYQVGGRSQSGRPVGWRWAKLAEIEHLTVLEETFDGSRATGSERHIEWTVLFATVSGRETAHRREHRG